MPTALSSFIKGATSVLAKDTDEAVFLPKLQDLMKTLVLHDDWLDASFTKSNSERYQQYLLYADPSHNFSIVSFVWGPGQQSSIHNHTVWGVIGILRGAENVQDYEIDANGKPVPLGVEMTLSPGEVASVSPTIGDIHRVRNAYDDRVSISIHAYGGSIGKIQRLSFPADGGPPKTFVSGYSAG